MNLELFISFLVISATTTSVAIEIIKILLDKLGITYKTIPLTVIIAFLIGVIEIFIYTINCGTEIDIITILYAVCMGIANVVGSNVGYDKVKELIYSLFGKPE